jgi:hypothetical protein
MVEVERTLVKSPPELWEIVDNLELIRRLSAELFGSDAIEVVEREPGKRLAWQVSDSPEARGELALAEKGWGTQVAIRVGEHSGGGEEIAGAVLELLLDELGSARRRPVAAPHWMSDSGEAAARGGNREGAIRGIEDRIETTIEGATRSAPDRTAAPAERGRVGRFVEKAAGPVRPLADGQAEAERSDIEPLNARRQAREADELPGEALRRAEELLQEAARALEMATKRLPRSERRSELKLVRAEVSVNNALERGGRSLDQLSDLIARRASEQIEKAVQSTDERLAELRERLRLETEEAHRGARERIEEAGRRASDNQQQRELTLARRERDRRIQVAERRLVRQAAAILTHLEREVGRRQERARRVAAAAAGKEVDRRVGRTVTLALRDIEATLTATIRTGIVEVVGGEPKPLPGGRR